MNIIKKHKNRIIIGGALIIVVLTSTITGVVLGLKTSTSSNKSLVGLAISAAKGNGDENPFIYMAKRGVALINGTKSIPNDSYKIIESKSRNAIINDLYNPLSKKYDVIIAPGEQHLAAIKKFREDNPKSKTKFLLIDKMYTDIQDPNVYSIGFNVRRASFQAGYLTGLYLEKIKHDNDPKVGLWGGADYDGVKDYLIGFVGGIKYYNDHNPNNKKDVKFIKFIDDEQFNNRGFTAKNGKGNINADYLVKNGADVILPVAGEQIKDVINAIGTRKDIKIIGVDRDQAKQFPKSSNLFLTSIKKDVDRAIRDGYKFMMDEQKRKNIIKDNDREKIRAYYEQVPNLFFNAFNEDNIKEGEERNCTVGLFPFYKPSNENVGTEDDPTDIGIEQFKKRKQTISNSFYTGYTKQYASETYRIFGDSKISGNAQNARTDLQKQWETQVYDLIDGFKGGNPIGNLNYHEVIDISQANQDVISSFKFENSDKPMILPKWIAVKDGKQNQKKLNPHLRDGTSSDYTSSWNEALEYIKAHAA